MELDLTSFHRAIRSLESAIRIYESFKSSPDDAHVQLLKAGVVQNFEFTYELAWKFIKRWLEINVSPTTGHVFSRRELFRYAAENGLIDDVSKWFKYNETRNITSHTYDEEKANRVVVDALAFKDDVIALYNALEERN
ncbi:MAG: nucleotidyltransferase substrate binding protein [Defluviitaleaceae bacterium]|nr:nucleotidyltransferase substrate binding protein [Defluviitaleaceae bacterium]